MGKRIVTFSTTATAGAVNELLVPDADGGKDVLLRVDEPTAVNESAIAAIEVAVKDMDGHKIEVGDAAEELKGEALKARAAELGVDASGKSADELRDAVADAEEQAAA